MVEILKNVLNIEEFEIIDRLYNVTGKGKPVPGTTLAKEYGCAR